MNESWEWNRLHLRRQGSLKKFMAQIGEKRGGIFRTVNDTNGGTQVGIRNFYWGKYIESWMMEFRYSTKCTKTEFG